MKVKVTNEDIKCLPMENNHDDGPTRKVARARKRSSSWRNSDNTGGRSSAKCARKDNEAEIKQPTQTSSTVKEEWFTNSFCREKSSETMQVKCMESLDRSSNDSGVLDTSDALLADLDLEAICLQSLGQCHSSNICTEQTGVTHQTGNSADNNSQIFSNLGETSDDDLFEDGQIYSAELEAVPSSSTKVVTLPTNSSNDGRNIRPSSSKDVRNVLPNSLKGDRNPTESNHGNQQSISQKNTMNLRSTNLKERAQTDSKSDVSQRSISHVNSQNRVQASQPMSLKDRLKHKMKRNSLAHSTVISAVEQSRQQEMERALRDASQMQKQGTDVDIGPFYGLPSKVQKLLETQRGITKFYDWQDECLRLPAVMAGQNLIYSLPTSGGKTLVAEILILRELLCKKKNAILILPYVAIVQEKVRNLSEFSLNLDFLVEEYAGSKGRFPPLKRRRKCTLYVATLEKSHSLVNSLIETQNLESLGLAVVDELHMIGEGGSRGAVLEATLLKLRHCGATQIIGMSATLNNIEDLQTFLQAETYSNNFRPVKLTEYVKVEENLFLVAANKNSEEVLTHDRVVMFPYSEDLKKQDPDHLLGLVLEVIPDNSCLIFCHTKKNCENVALMLAKLMIKYHKHLTLVKKAERRQLLRELYQDGNGQICPVLEYTVHLGIAYHHSGLTSDERRLIEDAYSEGKLCLLTCTSTLAAGVNLPAKRVILRSPYVGSAFISHSQYKQMTGRAGRAGIDDSGESILIGKKSDASKVRDLLTMSHEPCYSSLMYDGGKGIRSMLLSAIGLKILKSVDEILGFMKNTLLSVQASQLQYDVESLTLEALQQLLKLKLIRRVRNSDIPSHNTKSPKDNHRKLQSTNGTSSHSLQGCDFRTMVDSQSGSSAAVKTPSRPVPNTASQNSAQNSMQTDTKQESQISVIIDSVSQEQGVGCQATRDSDSVVQLFENVDLEVTPLGRATFKGSINLDYSSMLYFDLKKAEESLVLASYLHLLFLVTPYDMARDVNIPWMVYFTQMSMLNPVELRVANLIGVPESYIAKKASGQSSRQKVDEFLVSRFYLTLMLYELWHQKTVWQVAQRFQANRGFVQNLLNAAASFASCVFHFCQELDEFWAFQDLLGNFVKRLSYCVSMELIPLMEIPGVKLGRARQLYSSGQQTLQDVAAVDPEWLAKNIEHLPRKTAKQIVASAKVLLNEKAEALWEEVENLQVLSAPAIQQ